MLSLMTGSVLYSNLYPSRSSPGHYIEKALKYLINTPLKRGEYTKAPPRKTKLNSRMKRKVLFIRKYFLMESLRK